MATDVGRSAADAASGCQPTASAADASSRSGIPNATHSSGVADQVVSDIVRDVAELPGDDYDENDPGFMRVSADDLRIIVERNVSGLADERSQLAQALDLQIQNENALVEHNRQLLWLVANLEPLCANPADGAPFEDGEVPYIDEARTLIRLNDELLMREAGVRFLDDMAANSGQSA